MITGSKTARLLSGQCAKARTFASAATGPISDTKKKVGVVLFGTLVVGTAGLGSWQVHRYQWKVGKIERRKEELQEAPAPLDDVLLASLAHSSTAAGAGAQASSGVVEERKRGAALDAAESKDGSGFSVKRAVVAGVWEHDRSMLIGRRGAPDGLVGDKPQGMGTSPSGYFLCTSLRLIDDDDDGGDGDGGEARRVVVNRGWMPAKVAEAQSWSRPEGVVGVTGVVVQGEAEAAFSPVNNPETGTMLWLQLPVLADALGVKPLVVKKRSTDSDAGGGGGGGEDLLYHSPVLLEVIKPETEGATTVGVTPKGAAAAGGHKNKEPDAVEKATEEVVAKAVAQATAALARQEKKKENGGNKKASPALSTATKSPPQPSSPSSVPWPLARGLKSLESFPVMPETHAVYAVTWWSLSAFGLAAAFRLLNPAQKKTKKSSAARSPGTVPPPTTTTTSAVAAVQRAAASAAKKAPLPAKTAAAAAGVAAAAAAVAATKLTAASTPPRRQ